MKKVIVIFVLAIALITIFLIMRPEKEELVTRPEREELAREFNLTEPLRHTLTINGEECSFLLARYDPPLFHTEIEPDLSTPEGATLIHLSDFLEIADLKFLLRVDMEYEEKKYAIIQSMPFVEGEELPAWGTVTFVKEGDAWLRTDDIRWHPVSRLVRLKTYEEIREILKEGTWDPPGPSYEEIKEILKRRAKEK